MCVVCKLRLLHGKRARTGFSHELVKYLKSNERAQRTNEISDTSPTSVKIPYKALSMLKFVYFIHTEIFFIYPALIGSLK